MLYRIVDEGSIADLETFYPMPAFGEQLSQEEIDATLFYIKTFWTTEQRQNQTLMTEAIQNQ